MAVTADSNARGIFYGASAIDANNSPAMLIWHDGSGGATAATLTVEGVSTPNETTLTFVTTGGYSPGVGGQTSVAGVYTGVIDTALSATNTAGEIADTIRSAKGWNCILQGLLRSDNIGGRTDIGRILDRTVLTCYGAANAIQLYLDESEWAATDASLGIKTICIGPEADTNLLAPMRCSGAYWAPTGGDITNARGAQTLATPMIRQLDVSQAVLDYFKATVTGAGSTHTISVTPATQYADLAAIYSLGGIASATTTTLTKNDICAFTMGPPGCRLVVRIVAAAAALTALVVSGIGGRYGSPGSL